MESFNQWWEGLSVVLKIYWAVAVPSTLFFMLQLAISFFGDDTTDDLPYSDADGEQGIGFRFLTLKNIVGFFTIFGWTGIACTESGLSLLWTIVISVSAGLTMMLIMGGLFYLLLKAGADGAIKD